MTAPTSATRARRSSRSQRDLVTHLETETHKKALLAARARAQVVIDILVRNLFERTADVGFLAADDAIRSYAAASTQDSETKSADARTMQRRLAEYVSKYSVYHNVILLSPHGEVLLQLEGGQAPAVSSGSADRRDARD